MSADGPESLFSLSLRCRKNIRDFMKSCFAVGPEPGERSAGIKGSAHRKQVAPRPSLCSRHVVAS